MGREKPPVTMIDTTVSEAPIVKPKEKRRSNEKRKEKSRDAARCRRSRETDLFTELGNGLPIKNEEVEQLDKASVMRLAISFLKIHDVVKFFPQIKDLKIKNEDDETKSENSSITEDEVKPFDRFCNNKETIQMLNNCLDGFLMILSSEGDITYSTESISEYLGISQIDILGNPIWDYIHQCDHDEFKEALNIRKNSLQDTIKDENDKEESEFKTCHRDLFIRFKCTLTSRGRSVNIKSASYKVIHLVGHMILNKEGERILIVVGRPIPHPSNIEIPLGTTTFLTKHSLDMKFTYVDEKMQQELQYKADDLLGKSLYNYHHSCDSENLMATFKSALSKGQGETCRYRFLGKYGGYCWLVTQATLVYDKQKPQSVVCVNYLISQLENENEIYSYEQFEAKNKDQRKKILCNSNNNNNAVNNNSDEISAIKNKNNKNTNENQLIKLNINTKDNIEAPITTTTSTTSIFKTNQNQKIVANNNNLINQNYEIRENSLSPLRQTLKNFTIHTKNQQQKQEQQQQQQQKDLTDSTIIPVVTSGIKCDGINGIVINNNNNSSYLTDLKSKTLEYNNKNNNINNNNNNKIAYNKKIIVVGGNQQRTSLFNNKNTNNNRKIEETKKPKSVTASVFTQVKPNERNSILLNTNATFNVASRAQSVTASIFKPISQVTNNNLLLTTTTIATNKLINNGNIINNNNNVNIDKNKNNNGNNNNNNNIITGIQNNTTVIPKVQILSSSITNNPSIEKRNCSEDMNKGYISFTEDADLTMLKEEPDDLTHLAPTAGDSCIPLDDSTPLFGEMLEGLILPDSYASLLPDEINSLDSQQSNNQNNCNNNINNNNNNKSGGTSIDPFINYRDDTSDTASSPHLLSPGGLSKSPEASSLPSLCSPHSLSQEDEFAFMTMNVEDDIDLSMRAPYIPMNEQDDLPLLTDDLMWSAFTEELSLHKDMKDVMQIPDITALKNQINQTNHNCYNNNNINDNNNSNNNSNNNVNNNHCLTTQLNSIAQQSHLQQQQQSTQIIGTSILQTSINNNNNNNIDIINNNSNDENIILNKLQTIDDIQNCKKRKYIDDSLCDSIDAFGQVFNNKNCSNLDCWSVTDLLQLDQENMQFNEKSSNIIISNLTNSIGTTLNTSSHPSILTTISPISTTTTTGTTTIHVPLITIQNNQKINNQLNNNNNKLNIQIKDENNCTKSILENQITTINNINNNKSNPRILNSINSNNNTNNNTSQVNTVKLIPHSTIILNGSNITNNKRPIIGATTILDSKRIKSSENSSIMNKTTQHTSSSISTTTTTGTNTISNSGVLHQLQQQQHQKQQQQLNGTVMQNAEIQTTPHLLQQLIAAPNPKNQKDNQRIQTNLSGIDKYNNQNNKKDNDELLLNKTHNNHLEQLKQRQLQQQQLQYSPSNSVLKNLLVSGCDGTSPLPPLITDDESSQEEIGMNTPDQMSPCTYYNRPYSCRNVTAQLIRNCGANPMIGGPIMLPSPTISEFLNSTTNSSSACSIENEMSNDSGIDDTITKNNCKNSLKLTFDEVAFDLQKQLEMKKSALQQSSVTATKLAISNTNDELKKNEINSVASIIVPETFNNDPGTGNFNRSILTKASESSPPYITIMSNNTTNNYFKNQYKNQQFKNELSLVAEEGESMIIENNDIVDTKLTSLPLIDESAGPFGTSFLMDFDYNMETSLNDDFLVDNWTNSLM